MDPLEKLADDYRKISNPTLEDMKHFNDVFAATKASLEAANKPAGPPVTHACARCVARPTYNKCLPPYVRLGTPLTRRPNSCNDIIVIHELGGLLGL